MWQTKELREGVFGSVATKGLSSRFLGCVANKELSDGVKILRPTKACGCSKLLCLNAQAGASGVGVMGILNTEITEFAEKRVGRGWWAGGMGRGAKCGEGWRGSIGEFTTYDNTRSYCFVKSIESI